VAINNSGSHGCDICGSNTLGYVCRCGEMRCSCEREPCQNCATQEEYNEREAKYRAEQEERENFEDRMQEKYH